MEAVTWVQNGHYVMKTNPVGIATLFVRFFYQLLGKKMGVRRKELTAQLKNDLVLSVDKHIRSLRPCTNKEITKQCNLLVSTRVQDLMAMGVYFLQQQAHIGKRGD